MSQLVLAKERTALLIMDMQNDIVHEQGRFAGFGFPQMAKENNIIAKIGLCADATRRAKVPVIYVTIVRREDYRDAIPNSGLFKATKELGALKEGSWGAQIIDELKPHPADFLVVKKRVNAFYGTNLEVVLGAQDISQLVLTGVATNFVVEATARDAADRGFDVIILRDCCASMNEEAHRFTLDNVLTNLATVSTSDEFLAALSRP